jgi:hypothetical protein
VPGKRAYPVCIFCGAKANSREHAIPKWMSKQLEIKVMMANRSGGLPARRHLLSFASHRARIFCQPCNTHFGKLEEAVIPLLVPMANGRVLSLGSDSQALLAQWAAKTAITLISERAEMRTLVPKAHKDSVRYDDRPHEHCWVGYAPWSGYPAFWIADNEVLHQRGAASVAYTAIFGFKKAAFQVVGVEPVPSGYGIDGRGYRIPQFWPPRPGLIDWPPEGILATPSDIGTMSRFGALVHV